MQYKKRAFLSILLFYTLDSFACEFLQNNQNPIQVSVQEMADRGYKQIDALFERAIKTVSDKETIMQAAWWVDKQDVKDVQNILSDSYIEFVCDQDIKNPVQPLLADYVRDKVCKDIPKIFDIPNVSEKRVKDFYAFSYVLLSLNNVDNATRIINKVKEENADKMLKLKIQKQIVQQTRKEQRRNLAEAIIMGVRK